MSKIEKILYDEMKDLLNRMNNDFEKNYNNKVNNWILDRFDNDIRANMVFVSSFESKYGNMFENISQSIAKIKFGEENVKLTFKGAGVTDEEYKKFSKEILSNVKKSNSSKKFQYIVTKLDNQDEIFADFSSRYRGDGRKRIPSKLSQSKLPELLKEVHYSDNIIKQPVDLVYYDSDSLKFNIFEIKAGGNLDSSNSKKNVEKMLKIYASLGKKNSNLFFATLYHKDGENNNWKGSVKYQVAPDILLIGERFWEKILPEDMPFDDFKNIYYDTFDKLDFEANLSNLIDEFL